MSKNILTKNDKRNLIDIFRREERKYFNR